MPKADSNGPQAIMACLTGATLLFLAASPAADAAAPVPQSSSDAPVRKFPLQDGKSIYEGVCQGCHMAGGKGAAGAGMYPALANNPKLEVAGYPAAIIINGQKAMPPLGQYFDDRQIAEIVNYIRTHFGNRYTDKMTAGEVKTMR